MRRVILVLLAMGLCGSAAAAELVQASVIQQNTLQLRTDVVALRAALTRTDLNPQTSLTAALPALLERARAASAQATEFRKRIEASLASAARKREAAEVDHQLDQLEALIQQLASLMQQVSATVKKLDEIAQKIEEILPLLMALVGSDPGTTLTCSLPHASATVVKGVCAIASCEKGWVNADGNAANGCEAPLG